MATLTVYPNADPESVSVDGYLLHQDLGGLDWTVLRAAAGTAAYPSLGSGCVGWRCDGITNKFDRLRRTMFLFDTSVLPDGCVIISAMFSFYLKWCTGAPGFWGWGADSYFNIYSCNPASNTDLVASDFSLSHFGADAYCDNPIRFDDIYYEGSIWKDFLLNGLGKAAISKTGITKIGLREATYDVGAITPPWVMYANPGQQLIDFEMADGSPRPKLVITYEEAGTPTVEAINAINVTETTAILRGKIVDDVGAVCEWRFRYRTGTGEYLYTTWTNGKVTGDIFSKGIAGLTKATQYEFAAQARNPTEGEWSAPKYFTYRVGITAPRLFVPVEDKVTLELVRNVEMSAAGRVFVDKEGNLEYDSRYRRLI